MDRHVVRVDLIVKKKGPIKISVDPWEQHSKIGDTVSWAFTGDITSGKIDVKNKRRAWPFEGPRPPLRGTKRKRAKTGVRTEHRLYPVTIPYTITLTFKDPASGAKRLAVIDPDMVVDA